MSSGFFRGTTNDQDSRFGNAEKKLMAKMSFAPTLSKKIDLKKVNMPVIKKWITEKLTEYLGFEEEVTIGLLINYLEQDADGKKLQLQCTEFIGKNKAQRFTEELWALLDDAQSNPSGIPTAFIEAKKRELEQAATEALNPSQAAIKPPRVSRFSAPVNVPGEQTPPGPVAASQQAPPPYSGSNAPPAPSADPITADMEMDERRRGHDKGRFDDHERKRRHSRSPPRHRRTHSRDREWRKRSSSRSPDRGRRLRSGSRSRERGRERERQRDRRRNGRGDDDEDNRKEARDRGRDGGSKGSRSQGHDRGEKKSTQQEGDEGRGDVSRGNGEDNKDRNGMSGDDSQSKRKYPDDDTRDGSRERKKKHKKEKKKHKSHRREKDGDEHGQEE